MINTYFIYRVSVPVAREAISAKLTLGEREKTEGKDAAACYSATVNIQKIDKPEDTACAGQQWGSFKLEGENVIAYRIEEYRPEGFDEFLKANGYETIPEKEEEPK